METATDVYAERTEQNVRDSDATLVLVRGPATGGTKQTIDFAILHDKPCLVIDLGENADVGHIREWLQQHAVRTLNVAGPRESEAPGIYEQSKTLIHQLLLPPGIIRHDRSRSCPELLP